MTELGLIEGIIIVMALGGIVCLIWLKHQQDELTEMQRDIKKIYRALPAADCTQSKPQ